MGGEEDVDYLVEVGVAFEAEVERKPILELHPNMLEVAIEVAGRSIQRQKSITSIERNDVIKLTVGGA